MDFFFQFYSHEFLIPVLSSKLRNHFSEACCNILKELVFGAGLKSEGIVFSQNEFQIQDLRSMHLS